MIHLLEAKTVAGTRYGAGDVVNFISAIEAELVSAGEAEVMPVVLTYTWATRPNYSTTDAGTVISISDVGGSSGSFWKATSGGWVPLNGSVVLASNWGSLAAPVATQTGSTGALFVPTGGAGSLVIPATMLITSRSALEIEAMHRRRGATATAILSIYLGTAGTVADSKVFDLSVAATNNQDNRPAVTVGFTTGVATISNWLAPGSANASAYADKTTNINIAAAMKISFGISAANAADAFDLVGYTVRLNSI